jgi:hypothetical protein
LGGGLDGDRGGGSGGKKYLKLNKMPKIEKTIPIWSTRMSNADRGAGRTMPQKA